MRYRATRRDTNEADLVRELRQLGFLVIRLDPKDEPGLPDLLVLRDGRTVLVETKTRAGQLSPVQRAFMRRWLDCGGEAIVARTVEDVLRWYGILEEADAHSAT